MADIVEIDVDLDPAGYLQGVNQLDQANAMVQRSMGGVVTSATLMQRAMNQVTPSRATIAGMTLLAREAAQTEQGLSGLAATSATTGISVGKLSGTMKSLARDFPLGYQASKQTVEMFTQMGVSSAGSEAKISKLATTVTKLSGATGEGPQVLAKGMTDLARATGNSSLDPRRFAALADSLTTVTAQSGASAGSVLAFSKNIAPMAQAAGIGSTNILGIATAFSKIGEEGFGAQTAINKMLTDMSRSVREGTPELKTYAEFVGQTAEQFERLFKANPTEALTQVTEAIAAAGPRGPRMLEQIGIEGVRGQRAIQALVASGGLRPATEQATAAYGSGSTQKAAEAAFGGLTDSLTELAETARQTGEALGTPLLGGLTAFTNALKVPTEAARAVVSSDFVQKAIQIGATAAIGAMVAKNILGPVGALGLGRQMLTSSPLAAMAAGFSSSDPRRDTFLARYGARSERLMQDTGFAGRGVIGRNIATPLYRMAAGMRTTLDQALIDRDPGAYYDRMLRQQQEAMSPNRPANPLRRMLGGGVTWASQLGAIYAGNVANQMFNARVPLDQRTDRWGGSGIAASRSWQNEWNAARANNPDSIFKSLREFDKGLRNNVGPLASFGTAVKAHGAALVQSTRLLGNLVGRPVAAGFGMAARGAGAILGSVGGLAGLGVMGGFALMQNQMEYRQRIDDERKAFSESSVSEALDRYRESMGMATGPTTTHGGLAESMARAVTNATKTFSQARAVTEADRAAAEATKDKVSTTYAGTPEAVVQQIQGLSPTGLSPQELQAVKVDLLRQRSSDEVTRIMSMLPASVQGGESVRAPTGSAQVGKLAAAIGQAQNDTSGLFNWLQGASRPGLFSSGSGFGLGDMWNAPNELFWRNQLTEEQRQQAKTGISDTIASRFASQAGTYEGRYAEQQRNKAIDEAYREAVKTGNVDLVETLSRQFSAMLGGEKASTYLAPSQVEAAGGFAQALAQQNEEYNKTFQEYLKATQAQPGGTWQPQVMQSYISRLAGGIAPTFANFFDTRQAGPTQQAVQASLNQPGDISKQTRAIDAMVRAAQQAGTSMEDLAVEANRLAGTMDATNEAYALVIGSQRRAEREMARENIGATDMQRAQRRLSYVDRIANQPPSNNPEIEANRQAAEDERIAIMDQMAQRMRARLQAQRQFEVAVTRLEEDAAKQRRYAAEDYERSLSRTIQGFQIQRREQVYQYNKGVERAEADFATQRARTIRDFNIQAERAERDYLRTRMRQIRDFNIQLRRQIEDAAASMMDPYKRIQTQATWDARNLIVNLQEQVAAMQKQASQLDQLRSAGLSASAIDQLGLGKVENAQQVNNLVADMKIDPSIISQLNAIAEARAKASGALFTDESNKDLARQQEDFRRALADQAADYATAVRDNRESLQRGLADSQRDFNKTMTRAREDYQHALALSQQQLGITLDHMAEDYARAYKRTEDARRTTLRRMREDLRMADETITGDFKTLNEQLNRALNGQAVNWRKIVQNETKTWVSHMNTSVLPMVTRAFSQLGLTPAPTAQQGSITNYNTQAPKTYGRLEFKEGGQVPGWAPHPKADNVVARLTPGEYVQPVDAVQHYGPEFMEAVRLKRIPKEAVDELPKYAVGGRVSPVNAPPSFPWGSYPSGGYHPAIDYAVPTGTPVRAPYDAKVMQDGWSSTGYGVHLRLANLKGTFTILGHLLRDLVSVGQLVRAGQHIAYSDNTGRSTGPHLHEEERTRAYDQSSAFNFLKGQVAGVIGTSALAGALDVDKLFAGLDPNRGGIYGMLTRNVKTAFAAKYDEGGIMRPGVGVHVNATAKPEAVLTDEQWNDIHEVARLVSAEDVRNIRAARGAHITVNSHDTYNYDYRNDFNGAEITVMADDPDEFARELEQRQIRSRLTQTRGVNRGS